MEYTTTFDINKKIFAGANKAFKTAYKEFEGICKSWIIFILFFGPRFAVDL